MTGQDDARDAARGKGSAPPSDESAPPSGREDAGDADDQEDAGDAGDQLPVDPDTLIVGRPGTSPAVGGEQDGETRADVAQVTAGQHRKRNGIHIRLQPTDRRGRYALTPDDPEIRAMLRTALERAAHEAEGKHTKPRVNLRDHVFTRRFTTFDRQNPASADSPFFGFFTLFWLCMFLIFVQVALRNWRDYGSWLGGNQVMRMMFSREILLLGITDGLMWLSALQAYFFQTLVSKGYISWARSGWVLQNVWQMAYLGAVVGWAQFRQWPWTHTIFVVLHALVFLMKQHSYAFYNGYLSGVYRRKHVLEQKLKELASLEPVPSAPNSPISPRESSMEMMSTGADRIPEPDSTKKRRPSAGLRTSTNLHTEHSAVAQVAAAVESGQSLSAEHMSIMSDIVKHEVADLDKELRGKADTNAKAYPNNLTLANFVEYTVLPTLVYELDYPRQEKTNWWYVLEKSVATFGVLCVMQVVSQGFIYPLVRRSLDMKESNMPLEARWRELPFIVSDMLFPMLIEQLLTWYVIWECILNLLAEVTRFADRGFYGDWWNSVTWDQYARDWNRPVHNFLLRHVYHSSISTFHLSRTAATFVTFLLSALVHEMCMALIFSKVRGYLFWMQLMQMPLVALSRGKFMKGRVVLGNTIFWTGLFIGPAFLTSLYLVI